MPRLREFIKKNYVLFTVFSVILIVCIASLIIIHLINSFRPHVDVTNENGAYYQLFGNKKHSFDANLRKENGAIKDVIVGNYSHIDLYPIYYTDKDQIIVTEDSAVVLYMKGFKSYKIPKYSELIYSGENQSIIVNGVKYLTNDNFVYDASGNYIVMDYVTLKYNNKTVKLSPLSLVNASAYGLKYYDYENDKYVEENIDIKNASLVYDTFDIDIIKNIVIKNGKKVMLKRNVDSLAVYKED